MGSLTLIEKIQAWIESTGIICLLRGHAFEYEPMPGDEPPFLFSHCARCDKERE